MRYLLFVFQCYLVYVGCDEAEAISAWKQLEKQYDFVRLYRIYSDYGFLIFLKEYVPTDRRVGSQFTSHSDLVAQPHTWVEVKWETLGPQPLRSA